jgi:DNA polymerase III subunit epsilon
MTDRRYKLVFDTETTGLPDTPGFQLYHDPRTNLDAYDRARLVSIAWLLVDVSTHEIVAGSERVFPVAPSYPFDLDPANVAIHGYTKAQLQQVGVPIHEVMARLMADIREHGVQTLVAHNVGFDYHVCLAELVRLADASMIQTWESLQKVCTYSMTNKRLVEAYRIIVGKPLQGAHNALADAVACAEVYKALM